MPGMKGIIVAAALLAVAAVACVLHSRAEQKRGEEQQTKVVKVASLHPLLSEMARRVGGEAVEVVDLFPAAAELHAFTPTGADVAAAAGSKLLLACGKGVEPYLRDLRDSLPGVNILELGALVPDVMTPDGRTPDPHWWSTPENMKHASVALSLSLAQLSPENAQLIAERQEAYARQMDELMRRARLELSRIPANRRVLVSAHAAMCHFCAAFRFKPIAVQGVAQESEGDTAQLARLLADLRAQNVRCLFRDVKDSPRFLENLAAQTGSEMRSLYMDGTHPAGEKISYEEMFLHNVTAIREGLQAPSADAL